MNEREQDSKQGPRNKYGLVILEIMQDWYLNQGPMHGYEKIQDLIYNEGYGRIRNIYTRKCMYK